MKMIKVLFLFSLVLLSFIAKGQSNISYDSNPNDIPDSILSFNNINFSQACISSSQYYKFYYPGNTSSPELIDTSIYLYSNNNGTIPESKNSRYSISLFDTIKSLNVTDNIWYNSATTIYNSTNKLLNTTYYDEAGSIKQQSDYTYNANGQVLTSKKYLVPIIHKEKEYDSDNRLIVDSVFDDYGNSEYESHTLKYYYSNSQLVQKDSIDVSTNYIDTNENDNIPAFLDTAILFHKIYYSYPSIDAILPNKDSIIKIDNSGNITLDKIITHQYNSNSQILSDTIRENDNVIETHNYTYPANNTIVEVIALYQDGIVYSSHKDSLIVNEDMNWLSFNQFYLNLNTGIWSWGRGETYKYNTNGYVIKYKRYLGLNEDGEPNNDYSVTIMRNEYNNIKTVIDSTFQSGTNGAYSVRKTNYYYYPDSASAPSSIQPINNFSIQAYPNPTTDDLTIVLPNNDPVAGWQISIYQNNGRRVFSATITEQKTSIDMSKLAAGDYMLEIKNNKTQSLVHRIKIAKL